MRSLRQVQFPEDAGPMAHPVRPDSYVEINNFYTSTVYEKGAEVVRMMQTLVGRDGFARGMTLYFERHDGQAVTCDDFAQAIADANPASELARLLPQFKRWYAQSGTPRVTARGRYDAPSRTYTLGLEQSSTDRPPTGAVRDPAGDRPGRPRRAGAAAAPRGRGRAARRRPRACSSSSEARSFFTFVDVDQPPVLSLLRGFSAPVVLVDGLGDADLLVLLRHDSDPFNRWEAGQRLALNRLLAAVRSGEPALLDAAFVDAMRDVLRHPTLDAGLQGAGADAAERGLRRRAARQRRPAARSTPRARR